MGFCATTFRPDVWVHFLFHSRVLQLPTRALDPTAFERVYPEMKLTIHLYYRLSSSFFHRETTIQEHSHLEAIYTFPTWAPSYILLGLKYRSATLRLWFYSTCTRLPGTNCILQQFSACGDEEYQFFRSLLYRYGCTEYFFLSEHMESFQNCGQLAGCCPKRHSQRLQK